MVERQPASPTCASLSAIGATASTGAPQEAGLNGFRQFKAPLGGIDLHFIHEEGKGPNPTPLLISHGWPGSIVEFHKILPMLTDPARFGADPADAFTVVAPSLPGYTFSFAPGQKRFGVAAIAELFASLMSDVLGYRRFAAQGGDWGAFIASRLAYQFPERLIGIHLNMLAVRRDPKMLENPTAEEKTYLIELNHFLKEETGYQWIQGTKPTTLAFGLTDSPAGLAAWIVEKFRTWTDCGGDIERAVAARRCWPTSRSTGRPARSARLSGPITTACIPAGRFPTARGSRRRPVTPSFPKRSCGRRARWRRARTPISNAGP